MKKILQKEFNGRKSMDILEIPEIERRQYREALKKETVLQE